MLKEKLARIRKRSKMSVLVCFFWVFFFVLPSPLKAQTFSLSLWPPLLEVMLKPGKSITQVYELTNKTDAPREIITQIASFEPKGEQGDVHLKTKMEGEFEFNLENADIFLNKPFILPPKQKQQIILKIKAGKEAPEADYYFTLLFSTSPKARRGISGTYEAGVLGSHLLLTVSETGEPRKRGEIVEFSTQKIIDSLDKPEFRLRVKNEGRTFFKPFGEIKIKGPARQTWEIPLQPDNILASSTREIQTATGAAFPKFLLGPYQATVTFSLDEEEEKLSQTTSFLALPLKPGLGVAVAVLIILVIKSAQKVLFKKEEGQG